MPKIIYNQQERGQKEEFEIYRNEKENAKLNKKRKREEHLVLF